MVGYEQDVCAWSEQTAAALRDRRLDGVDWDAVAEEILDVSKRERSKLESALRQVLVHMLKWQFQPGKRTRSWELSIIEHRLRAKRVLEENPSLRRSAHVVVFYAYAIARVRAAKQTGIELDVFPEQCPFTLADVLPEA
jgi:hypothetical protein